MFKILSVFKLCFLLSNHDYDGSHDGGFYYNRANEPIKSQIRRAEAIAKDILSRSSTVTPPRRNIWQRMYDWWIHTTAN